MADEENQNLTVEHQPRPSGKDVPPSIERDAFCCPHCGAYTHQYWYTVHVERMKKGSTPFVPGNEFLEHIDEIPDLPAQKREEWKKLVQKHQTGKVFFENNENYYGETVASNLNLSKCYTCGEIAVWVYDRLLYPPQRIGPEPNEDLPEAVKTDYEEARSILNLSPRGAAAMLRLCVEKLSNHLEAAGASLDDKIADLVKKGLSVRVQRSLDAVRVIGNEAVHPGQMDLKDDLNTAETLFGLVNLIAEKMISEPKHVDAVYESLPQGKREAIERRDKGSA